MKVLIVNQGLAKRIRQRLPPEIEIIAPQHGDDQEIAALAAEADVILATRLSPEVARAASNLKLLQKTGAGVDDIPFDAFNPDVLVTNTSGANPTPLAEGALSLILALAKHVIPRHNTFKGGRSGPTGIALKDKKAGIIGMGSIGTEVAKRLQAFEMDILAIRRTPNPELKETLGLQYLGGQDDLDYVMKESDIIVVTAPLTPETRGKIGEHQINLMKPTALIVNVARAAIIQEKPLYNALKEGRIAGAALDVWWKPHFWDPNWNPEGADASKYPFWELPNVICTPHNIGSTDTQSDVGLQVMVENILRLRDGRPLLNPVNTELRY
jgi:phosphoglycerate dehydrogenase-like enzyme